MPLSNNNPRIAQIQAELADLQKKKVLLQKELDSIITPNISFDSYDRFVPS